MSSELGSAGRIESPTERILSAGPSPTSKTPAEIARLTGGINAVPESQVKDGSLKVVTHSPSIDELIESHADMLRCCEAVVSCITTHANSENLNLTLLGRLNDFTAAIARARRIAS